MIKKILKKINLLSCCFLIIIFIFFLISCSDNAIKKNNKFKELPDNYVFFRFDVSTEIVFSTQVAGPYYCGDGSFNFNINSKYVINSFLIGIKIIDKSKLAVATAASALSLRDAQNRSLISDNIYVGLDGYLWTCFDDQGDHGSSCSYNFSVANNIKLNDNTNEFKNIHNFSNTDNTLTLGGFYGYTDRYTRKYNLWSAYYEQDNSNLSLKCLDTSGNKFYFCDFLSIAVDVTDANIIDMTWSQEAKLFFDANYTGGLFRDGYILFNGGKNTWFDQDYDSLNLNVNANNNSNPFVIPSNTTTENVN